MEITNANQLTEMVPVSVLYGQLGRYINAGATGYLLENTSDIRPVAMTAKAVLEIGWGGVPRTSNADGAYYRQWATEEFGAKSAVALENIYKEYFNAPPPLLSPRLPKHQPGNAPPKDASVSTVPRHVGDNHYHTEARRLLLDLLPQHQVIGMPGQAPKWTKPRVMPGLDADMWKAEVELDIAQCEESQPRWDAVWRDALAAEPLVEQDRRNYYQFQVLTMITIHRESNRMLLKLSRSLQDYDAGNMEKALAEANAALQALDAVQTSMSAAEYGKWKTWYRGDWLTGVYSTHELVQDYVNHIKDPMAKLPAPIEWSNWEAYFHIMNYEGDRTVDVR